MAFPADALDVVDLRALADGGLILEDVHRKIFMLQTAADTPFTNLLATAPCNSDKTEWTFDDPPAPTISNAHVAGSRPSTFVSATGSRVSARAQIIRKALSVSSTAQASQLAGNVAPLAYETNKQLLALRQDAEMIFTSNQASVVGDNNTTPQKTAGFSAWISTNDSFGSGGASGGYNNSTHVTDAPTPGVGRALSWALVTAQLLAVFEARGNVRYLMSKPSLIQGINQKIVDGTIKVATPTANVTGDTPHNQVGQGYFTGVISDFGFMITFVPNRNQYTYTGGGTSSNVATCCDVLLIDPDHANVGYHEGYKVTELGPSSGLSTERDITASIAMMPRRQTAHAVIRDIKPTTAVTA